MNEVTYQKVVDQAGKDQVLIFVHSRKETAKTAKTIKDMALEKDTLGLFINPSSANREVLQDELRSIKDPSLQELLPLDSLYIMQECHVLIVLRLRICSLTDIFKFLYPQQL